MDQVIHYLELKNTYYEKFYNVTAKFLAQAVQDRWDDIEFFVDNRERILNIIRSFDFKISKLLDSVELEDRQVIQYRPQVKSLLDTRAAIAQRIVAQDLDLIHRIDEMKTDTIRELKKTLETSQQMSSFDAPSPAPTLPGKQV